MDLTWPVSKLAGAAPTRLAVNAGFHTFARRRMRQLNTLDAVRAQQATLLALVRKAVATRFGKDHRFHEVRSITDYQQRVPTRTYDQLWDSYLKSHYPVFDNLTWPGRIPFLALTSGTTTGTTKYIPVSWQMIASNQKAAKTMVASYMSTQPQSRLFRGKLFLLGGSTNLEYPATGVGQGDLSGIAAKTVSPLLRPYSFPPLDLALEPNWDRKLDMLTRLSLDEPVTLLSGVSSCLVTLFQRLLETSGKSTVAEIWPSLEVVVHGGVKFDPYRDAFKALLGSERIYLQESYPCSEGFVAFGDAQTGLLRLIPDHNIFFEFVPLDELDSPNPTRDWLGTIRPGINYAIVVSTCAGMWAHVIGDTVRFESTSPPLFTFTGRTKYTLSAFGEHVINEEIEAAIASASAEQGASVRDWHVGPVFREPLGYHQFVVEFLNAPDDTSKFRDLLDVELCQRNAHYDWFRAEGGGLPLPSLIIGRPGGFDAWMRSRGQLGGQHKVPRIDSTGKLTKDLYSYLQNNGLVEHVIEAGSTS